ncbi:MAG: GNAT family N-acetyltransferase, partial [Thermoproteota archaeon]
VEQWRLDDGRPVTLRPIRPEDEPLEFALFDTFSQETWRYRFFGPMTDVSHEDMVRFTNIDYRREMAIIGVLNEGEEEKMIGVGRLIIEPDGKTGEFAIVVGDPWQGLGLGEKLTDSIIGIAEDKGLTSIYGTILADNRPMINLCRKLGFKLEKEDEDTVKAVLRLR